jgi:hypothetical protein
VADINCLGNGCYGIKKQEYFVQLKASAEGKLTKSIWSSENIVCIPKQ